MNASVNEILNLASCKDTFAICDFAMLTIYDDNFFVRNDYDILSLGQRQHLQKHLLGLGFKQSSGKVMQKGNICVEFPTPNRLLSASAFQAEFIAPFRTHAFVVTPTMFAEALCYAAVQQPDAELDALELQLKTLIEHCPFNLELWQILAINTSIETPVNSLLPALQQHQAKVISSQFKNKRAY
ncbi:hypothetical protein QWY77_08685 [Thalassotalea ponticola]|uniref:hypothetical protein n=1 Tax=Thalassotalea ponticola TaxID=1523392 RepID=UPI0025B39786|nr:hypothetical protein [Thalassotalea ponticola]MDN3652838.1 hypothetical protein [Thalassotalea ponticola]